MSGCAHCGRPHTYAGMACGPIGPELHVTVGRAVFRFVATCPREARERIVAQAMKVDGRKLARAKVCPPMRFTMQADAACRERVARALARGEAWMGAPEREGVAA